MQSRWIFYMVHRLFFLCTPQGSALGLADAVTVWTNDLALLMPNPSPALLGFLLHHMQEVLYCGGKPHANLLWPTTAPDSCALGIFHNCY